MDAEELKLWVDYRHTRNDELRDRLFQRYINFAKFMANKHSQGMKEPDEFLTMAYVGLWKAIKQYDPMRSKNFTHYAGHRMRGEILDYKRDMDWVSRKYREAYKRGDVDTMPIQYQIEVIDESDSTFPLGIDRTQPNEQYDTDDLLAWLSKPLADRDREIATLRFKYGYTHKEISKLIGVSESRICQIISSITTLFMQRLKHIEQS